MPTDEESPDVLVPDVQVQQEFGVSRMTLVRWDKDQTLGFPVKIKIRQHNFRSRRALEKFKQQMFERAIADRNGRRASPCPREVVCVIKNQPGKSGCCLRRFHVGQNSTRVAATLCAR